MLSLSKMEERRFFPEGGGGELVAGTSSTKLSDLVMDNRSRMLFRLVFFTGGAMPSLPGAARGHSLVSTQL